MRRYCRCRVELGRPVAHGQVYLVQRERWFEQWWLAKSGGKSTQPPSPELGIGSLLMKPLIVPLYGCWQGHRLTHELRKDLLSFCLANSHCSSSVDRMTPKLALTSSMIFAIVWQRTSLSTSHTVFRHKFFRTCCLHDQHWRRGFWLFAPSTFLFEGSLAGAVFS